jgi:hypothetical protein
VGKTWQKNRFQADLYLGAAVNLWSQNQGRSLLQGQILDYEGSSNAVINNEWALHALFGSRLSYRLSDRVGLSTGIQLQKSLSNWSSENTVKMRPGIFNWHMGMSYYF